MPIGAEADQSAVDKLRVNGDGRSLAELSIRRPVFMVLLRHAGCTFHREALADLKAVAPEIDEAGAELAIVHMGRGENQIESRDSRYAVRDAPHFPDPDRTLYRELGLRRGKLSQLFGWREVTRGAAACLRDGHGVGALKGDGFQLGGLALVRDGVVVWTRPLESASERPDYVAAVREAMISGEPG